MALVTTAGFRDVYELGRTDREAMYSLTYRKPPSLVPRRRVFEVTERVDFKGKVVTPFDGVGAKRVAEEIRASGVGAVAVCFLHAYANPEHELAMETALTTTVPEIDVTLSHRLVREYREYERTSTAVIDSYVKPVVRRYLRDLLGALHAADFGGRFLVTRSAGGAMTVETAIAQPAHLVFSGPASGVVGAAAFGAMIELPNLITIDMGGTSLDASLIVGGSPTTVNEAYFHGQPLAIPSLNIHTIGAGGGSIAWLDPAEHLQVGPQSATAVPGPACYGRGGTAATVTDAALWVGYLGEDTALGGELTLRRPLADEAIGNLAERLGIDRGKVADGILDLTTTKVAGAVREITVEQGHDPRDFALLAFGGGGGLLACDVARDLGIPRVVIPPGPGAFSAFGMLLTDVVHDITQTKIVELGRIDPSTLEDVFLGLEQRARSALRADELASKRFNCTDLRTSNSRGKNTRCPSRCRVRREAAFSKRWQRPSGSSTRLVTATACQTQSRWSPHASVPSDGSLARRCRASAKARRAGKDSDCGRSRGLVRRSPMRSCVAKRWGLERRSQVP